MPQSRDSRLQSLWYGRSLLYLPLLPLTMLYAGVGAGRRALYRRGTLPSLAIEVPVVVVGNITVGGTGKTPVTVWLADQLRRRGFRPGIVSRGYGGVVGDLPVQANANSDPDIVGDEPLLLATRSRCPVVVHPDRVAAADELARIGVDVIISDDGLQHYRLQRDYEIVVIDGARGLGNGWQLPAGPLREPRSRLELVDKVLVHCDSRNAMELSSLDLPVEPATFHLVGHDLTSVNGSSSVSFDEMRGKRVHAVAGIGNPERFFRALEEQGLEVVRHPFPDHATFNERDLAYDEPHDIVMTEKDAVKCRKFASDRLWYVPVDVAMHDESWLEDLEEHLRNLRYTHGA